MARLEILPCPRANEVLFFVALTMDHPPPAFAVEYAIQHAGRINIRMVYFRSPFFWPTLNPYTSWISASFACALSHTSWSMIRSSGCTLRIHSSSGIGTCFVLPSEFRIVLVRPHTQSPTYFALPKIFLTLWWVQVEPATRFPTGDPNAVNSRAIDVIDLPSTNNEKISRTQPGLVIHY